MIKLLEKNEFVHNISANLYLRIFDRVSCVKNPQVITLIISIQDEGEYDVLLTNLEQGMAWSVFYPEYKPVLFGGRKIPVGYAVEPGNLELQSFLNSWVTVEKSIKSIDRFFNYWFKGENAVSKTPRWSIVRDVLHWIE